MILPTSTGLEHTPCPLCAAEEPQHLISGPDLLHPSDEQFQLVTCQHCGHIYQNPRPTQAAIGRYYPDNYAPYQRAIADEPRWLRRLERRYGRSKLCHAVHSYAGNPGRLLDVGCATGIFLDGMRELGWDVHGVEPSAGAARYARGRLKLDVFAGTLEAAQLPSASFDAITLWDVFEHVPEPAPVLAEISRLLRPNGVLVMSLPNPESLEARLLGADWLGWDLPRHLNLYRPLLLPAFFAQHQLTITAMQSFIYGYATLVMSINQRLRGKPYASIAARLLHSWPIRALAIPYYSGPANWYNLSSTVVLFARRQPYA